MAPQTRAKSAKDGAKDPNPKQTMKSKLYFHSREDHSKNTKRCRHCGASMRSEDTGTALQDTTNAAANVSAAALDSIGPVDPRESAEVPSPVVLPQWNGKRSLREFIPNMFTLDALANAIGTSKKANYTFLFEDGFRAWLLYEPPTSSHHSNSCIQKICQFIKRRSALSTKDELEVADFLLTEDFRRKWASASVDGLVAAAIMVQMKKDLNYSAPVQKVSRPNCKQTRRGRRS